MICVLTLWKPGGETFSTGVTLFVNGAVISGDLIHPLAYFKGVALLLETQPDEPNSINAAKFLGKTMRETIEKKTETLILSQEADDKKEPDVIYLMDAAFWNALRTVPIKSSFLALSIDAIDGFIWGKS